MWIHKYVFIVEAVRPFELLGTYGVFTSHKKAEEAVEKLQETFDDGSISFYIERKEVNPNEL